MNRFVLALVSCASSAGGLLGMPSTAQAQVVNVAPPAAYREREPSRGGPRGRYHYGHGGSQAGGGVRPHGASYERRWPRQGADERWERIRERHMRECARAYEGRAAPWVLARMQCPAY